MSLRPLALGLLLAGLWTPLACADLVTLRNGNVLEGETEITPAGLWIKRPAGSVMVGHEQVARVEQRETPWAELDRRLEAVEVGDAEATLEVAFFALDAGLTDDLERVVARALSDPLPRADAATVQLGMLCLEQGLEPQARRLLIHAITANPQSPTAALGLQRLDFHVVEGSWQAPEVYYPAQGFTLFEGRWVLPEEIALSAAKQALVLARATAAQAQEDLERAERAVDRSQDAVESSQENAARAEAQVISRREVLHARAQDLEIAEQRALAARYELQAFSPPPCTPPHVVRREEIALLDQAAAAKNAASEALEARDRALRALETILSEQARAPGRIADAKQCLLEDEVELARANDAATETALALTAAEEALQAARTALVAARQGS